MPKLLQINVDSALYSCGKICEEISIVAQQYGWDTYVAFGREHKAGVNKEIHVGNWLNVYEHFFEHRLLDNEGLASRISTKHLIKEIESVRPDIIQLHVIHDHWLNFPILFNYLNKSSVPVVWTFHDCWAITGHCFHFVTKNCMRWKEQCMNCPLSKEYPKSLIDKSKRNYLLKKKLFAGKDNLTIVSCSNWMDDIVRHSFLKDKSLCVIKNGIDLSVFKPTKQKEEGSFVVLTVSSVWNKEKGIYDVFKLRGLLPDSFIIVMVGLNKSQIKSIPQGIIGIERTNNLKDMVDLYSSSHVLINLTYADTFPTVNMESLACGTPVITYNTGGSPEIIDYKTGRVVDQGDVEAVAKEIIKMKEHPLSYKDCRERAETYFDKKKCFEGYINLYNKLINK